MTGGIVQGGWEFVWLAYGLSAVVVGGYAASVLMRLKQANKKARSEQP